MKLPAPHDRLADCIWLPRIVAKARCFLRGELPPEYEARFGHPTGVDGQFLGWFGLTRETLLGIVPQDDAGVITRFLALPGNGPAKIAEWNHVAVNLGRPGFPMEERLPVALATSYAHLAHLGIDNVLDVLAADEAAA